MKSLIKTVLRATVVPVLRALGDPIENISRIRAYVLLCARIQRRVDASVVVLGAPEVHGTGEIELGKDLLLYPGLYLETRGDGSIAVGDGVVISRGVHIVSYAKVSIGECSMIGEYTSIRDANHVRDEDGGMRSGAHLAADIRIGARVWIGRGVTILPGVSIGDDATVGANSVVTRDVPAGMCVVGAPAAEIRSRRNQGLRQAASV
jgi:acetyltransferase-like isoleucine patch superfamily enzyme